MEEFAIIQYGNAQYYLKKGAKLDLPRFKAQEGKEFTFDKVLLINQKGKIEVGTPYVNNAAVKVFVIKQVKGPKSRGFKYKAKSRYRRRWGYKQLYTRIRVLSIEHLKSNKK